MFFSTGVFLALTLDPHTKTMSDAQYKLHVAAIKRRTMLRGCLLAMGQFVSEAIKVMTFCVMVSSHFSFHGQSGAYSWLGREILWFQAENLHPLPQCQLCLHPALCNHSRRLPEVFLRALFQMCSDYEKSLVQPIYENDGLGPRALPETHPLLQDWQVRGLAIRMLHWVVLFFG